MIKAVYPIPDIEHDGDLQHYRTLITENGGEVIKVVWNGAPDDDAYIVFSAPTQQQVQTIKTILQDG